MPHKMLLFFSLMLISWYPFASGGVQPAHALIVLFSLLVIFTRGLSLPRWGVVFGVFICYVFLVEGYYALKFSTSRGLISPLFFLFNFMVCLGVYKYFQTEKLKTLYFPVIAMTAFALLGVIILGEGTSTGVERRVGTFNNPNQLGYFSVCAASMVFFLYKNKVTSLFSSLVLISVCVFLSILSLSKAAIIAVFFLLFFVATPRQVKAKNIAIVAGVMSLLLFAGSWAAFSGQLDGLVFYERIIGMKHESDSSLEARGYFAVFNQGGLELLFGLGVLQAEMLIGHEVHSTFGSVLNNYGVFGFGLFLYLMVVWAVSLWRRFDVVMFLGVWVPPFLYGITHNGTRFTIFWLLFAITMAGCKKRKFALADNGF